MKLTKEEMQNRLAELEQEAKDNYIEDISFNLIIEALNDDEQEEYKELYKKIYGEEF